MEDAGKLYYSITEVAELLGVTAPTLRFYEKEFPSLQPKKSQSGGRRLYTKDNIEHLTEILDLVNNKKFTLPGAREYIKVRDARQRENARHIDKLQKLKLFLEDLRDSISDENEAIPGPETGLPNNSQSPLTTPS